MFIEKNKCSGCGACYNVCPKKAIKMVEDEECFLYPQIDEEVCIKCGLCENVCPALNKVECEVREIYAAITNNEEIRMKSSSGGIFYELANSILSSGGYVCGAAFDDDYLVQHKIIDNINDLDSLMRSKYVQSKIGGILAQIKDLLIENKRVLFVGTTCQVNGLKNYLKKDYSNLITVDIICHGVPSPKIWKCYLSRTDKVINDKVEIENFNFRDKTNGWSDYSLSYNLGNLKILEPHRQDLFFKAFLCNLSLRPSCFECVAKDKNHNSDITLGDFWGYNNFDLAIKHENKGLSLIILHTEKGQAILNEIENLTLEKVDMDSLNYNVSYFKSVNKPIKRDEYMKLVNEDNFETLTKKYTSKKNSFIRKGLRKIKRIIFG